MRRHIDRLQLGKATGAQCEAIELPLLIKNFPMTITFTAFTFDNILVFQVI